MSDVRIYLPAINVMQSGCRGNRKKWVVEFVASEASSADPLMGWIGSSDTSKQIKLKFNSKEAAISYAKSKNLSYDVQDIKPRKMHMQNYSHNFSYERRF